MYGRTQIIPQTTGQEHHAFARVVPGHRKAFQYPSTDETRDSCCRAGHHAGHRSRNHIRTIIVPGETGEPEGPTLPQACSAHSLSESPSGPKAIAFPSTCVLIAAEDPEHAPAEADR
jgi:hypothetical protein